MQGYNLNRRYLLVLSGLCPLMTNCLIALGSNLGDRAATLDAAINALAVASGVELVGQSAWQLTMALGGRSSQPEFLNGAALLKTSRDAGDLHALLQQIENQLGRERHERWGDRTLDLDLLLYGDAVFDTQALTVPHPRMSFRRFVLEPAVEIAGPMVHPTIGRTLDDLLEQLDTGADCVAIVSAHAAMRADLASLLVQRFGLAGCKPSVRDPQHWPASTTWLAVPNGRGSTGHPKLTILLDLPATSEAGRGPLLRISSTNRGEVHREAFGAIAAVWPHLGSSGGQRLQ
jgi:2-amino-4-hydroxy-6-hydroxymethyldihydropteridine diphosphokinase